MGVNFDIRFGSLRTSRSLPSRQIGKGVEDTAKTKEPKRKIHIPVYLNI